MSLLAPDFTDEIIILRDPNGDIYVQHQSPGQMRDPKHMLDIMLRGAQMIAANYGLTIQIAPAVAMMPSAPEPAGSRTRTQVV